MSWTYDLTTDIGRVRRTIPDRVEEGAIWTDEEINSFLSDEEGNWRRATALALETMASDQLLVLKVIRVQNLETSTDRLMTAMLKRAQALRDQAATDEANAGDAFDVIEWVNTESQYKDRVWNQVLRGNL